MKYSILTLFPNIISAYINESIVKKAIDRNLINVEIIDIRNFAYQPHNQVDEYQAGGGKGMVLMVEPIVKAIESVKTNELKTLIILTTPQGQTWHQQKAKELANTYEHLIIICGHYEGFDERILKYIDVEVSIGDYVLTGGELPALIIVDSVSRMIKTVINEESSLNESFENNLLDYPVYTKPVDFRGDIIPDVLLSGHHANIQKFRDEQQIIKTYQNRPDLINESKLNKVQLDKLKELKGEK